MSLKFDEIRKGNGYNHKKYVFNNKNRLLNMNVLNRGVVLGLAM